MKLRDKVMVAMKDAMKAKDSMTLESLRAIKSAMLMAQTEKGAGGDISEAYELKILQKLVKQRNDSATLFAQQGREDLAAVELAQAAVISKFLPEQLTDEEIEKVVVQNIDKVGATGMQDMGKIMGLVTGQLAGKADGKTIARIVRSKLS